MAFKVIRTFGFRACALNHLGLAITTTRSGSEFLRPFAQGKAFTLTSPRSSDSQAPLINTATNYSRAFLGLPSVARNFSCKGAISQTGASYVARNAISNTWSRFQQGLLSYTAATTIGMPSLSLQQHLLRAQCSAFHATITSITTPFRTNNNNLTGAPAAKTANSNNISNISSLDRALYTTTTTFTTGNPSQHRNLFGGVLRSPAFHFHSTTARASFHTGRRPFLQEKTQPSGPPATHESPSSSPSPLPTRKLAFHEAMSLRLVNENGFLSWCRNAYISTVAAIGMLNTGAESFMAHAAGTGVLLIAAMNMLWGSGSHVANLFRLRKVAAISGPALLLNLAGTLAHGILYVMLLVVFVGFFWEDGHGATSKSLHRHRQRHRQQGRPADEGGLAEGDQHHSRGFRGPAGQRERSGEGGDKE